MFFKLGRILNGNHLFVLFQYFTITERLLFLSPTTTESATTTESVNNTTRLLSLKKEPTIPTMDDMKSGSVFNGEFSAVFVTAPSEEIAKKLANGLISEKLAACVNIIPKITSIYEWEGKVTEDTEAIMMIKTRTSIVDKLSEYIRKNHPYTIAEVISLPIQNGNHPYLNWIGESVLKDSS